jgi:hypothetical protein
MLKMFFHYDYSYHHFHNHQQHNLHHFCFIDEERKAQQDKDISQAHPDISLICDIAIMLTFEVWIPIPCI